MCAYLLVTDPHNPPAIQWLEQHTAIDSSRRAASYRAGEDWTIAPGETLVMHTPNEAVQQGGLRLQTGQTHVQATIMGLLVAAGVRVRV